MAKFIFEQWNRQESYTIFEGRHQAEAIATTKLRLGV